MTIKEAILKSLEDMKKLVTHWEILEHIQKNNYYDFKTAKTPDRTVSALLGDFIRKGDSRVSRIKRTGNSYEYYFNKYEEELELKPIENVNHEIRKENTLKNYHERDLHLLFSTYLSSKNIHSKTILHEQSNGTDSSQKWVHPDMISIDFLKLTNEVTQLVKALNTTDSFKLTSYELKKEIRTDHELKKCYFQAVSNSSWANYGYLVAFEISSSLKDEMERLNQSFGIGIIELKSYPYESKILYQSKYRELDFKTIDKLSKINPTFKEFIVYIEEIITEKGKNHKRVKEEFTLEFCDKSLTTDTEIETYCNEKNIPFENND